MQNLRKYVVPELVFGIGARGLLAHYIENFGSSHPLLVTDNGVIDAGWLTETRELLEAEGISYETFSSISPNPRAHEVMSGTEVFLASGCDAVIAIGGGSVMDAAKGIAICSTNDSHILTFEGIDRVTVPGPPLVCLPTTAGTSADVSQFAIINDTESRVKRSIISKAVVPDAALIDPEMTLTMDQYLTACTGMDALVHAIEAYVSTAHSPLFDTHAAEAIRVISTDLKKALLHPEDRSLRTSMMRASLEAGMAFSNASLGAVHAMAHSLGGYIDKPHGECNAILLEHVIAYNAGVTPLRYEEIAHLMGIPEKGDRAIYHLIEQIQILKNTIGINRTLGDLGVEEQDLAILAENAMKDVCMVTNPRRPDAGDIREIYSHAL